MTRLKPKGEGVEVWGDESRPGGFVWQDKPHPILEVANRWRGHTLWWSPGKVVWREYFKVATDSFFCPLYRDLLTGKWFLACVYG